MKRSVVVVLVLIVLFSCLLLLAFWLLQLGGNALMDALFTADIPEGFTRSLVEEIGQDAGISVPENAQWICGKRYVGEDYATSIVFAVPCQPEEYPERVARDMLQVPESWELDQQTARVSWEEFGEELPEPVGGFVRNSLDDGYAVIYYCNPEEGKLYLLLHYCVEG